MSDLDHVVQAGRLSKRIYVGRLTPNGRAFTRKVDRTDMVLAAVATYVREHYDGGMTATFPHLDGGLRLDVKVTPIAPEKAPDA